MIKKRLRREEKSSQPRTDRILNYDPSSLQINEDMVVISEQCPESDVQSKMQPFSRPISGATLEKTILPEIERHASSKTKEKLESRNIHCMKRSSLG